MIRVPRRPRLLSWWLAFWSGHVERRGKRATFHASTSEPPGPLLPSSLGESDHESTTRVQGEGTQASPRTREGSGTHRTVRLWSPQGHQSGPTRDSGRFSSPWMPAPLCLGGGRLHLPRRSCDPRPGAAGGAPPGPPGRQAPAEAGPSWPSPSAAGLRGSRAVFTKSPPPVCSTPGSSETPGSPGGIEQVAPTFRGQDQRVRE